MLRAKRIWGIIVAVLVTVSLSFTGCGDIGRREQATEEKSQLVGSSSEEYYMVTFLSGIEYWKGCYKGFEDAGKLYGIKTVFTGTGEYDVNKEVSALEQIIAKKPAGIAVTCINPDALAAPIKKAISAGIPVVTFDADSPNSGRYSFIATGNEYAGSVAAKALADQLGPEGGDVAVVTLPSQLNHQQRFSGFKKAVETDYKQLKLVAVGDGKGDQNETAKALAGIIQANPNIKGVFCTDATSGVGAATAVKEANRAGQVKIISFDTEKGTLDAIKSGVIAASIAQGTYVMGYQSMNFLYHLKHNLIQPAEGWKEKGIHPLPEYVDTGVSIVTKENVDSFYTLYQ